MAHEYDTSLEDSLTKSEGFSCIMEAHLVPSVPLPRNFFRTSAIKKAALYSTLLTWDYQNLFQTSSSSLPPLKCGGISGCLPCADKWPHNRVLSHILELIAQSFHILGEIFKFQNRQQQQQQMFMSLILRISPSHLWQ